MRRLSFILCLIFAQQTSSEAQIARKTIVEHFTNTKCGTCAARNPGLIANFTVHPEVLNLSVHPSSPYSTCFLSQQNTVTNDARTNYYGVYGSTPRVIVNGSLVSTSVNYGDTSLFSTYAGSSSFRIDIAQDAVGTDSLRSTITVHRVASGLPSGTALLFAGLVEDTVFGNGGNGEAEHYNVLRRSLYAPEGMTITLPVSVGDSTVYVASEEIDTMWNASRMVTVGILQDENTKEVIQSELSNTPSPAPIITGTELVPRTHAIEIYPNPVIEIISFNNLPADRVTYQMMDGKGSKILSGELKSGTIDTNDMPEGIYFLVLHLREGISTHKIMKH